jgi:hypothetical protein
VEGIVLFEIFFKINKKKFCSIDLLFIFVKQITIKPNTMKILQKDSQSRIVRYGVKCYTNVNGYKCQAYAHAKKVGNYLVISENYNDCIDFDGQSVSGKYKIITVGRGNIAEVICSKVD